MRVQLPQAPSRTEADSWKAACQKLFRSRITFVVLQVLDLTTTLLAFRMGGFELNPMVAHLTMRFGGFRGVLISKLICVAIAMGVRRLVWIVNLIYMGIVCWNLVVLLLLLSHARPH